MLYPRCCSLWFCTFYGLNSSDFYRSRCQTKCSHFNSYWGPDTTKWNYVHFLCSITPKIYFYHQPWNLASPKAYKTIQKRKKCVFFIFENKFERVTNKTHRIVWPTSGCPHSSTLYYKFVTGLNHHTDVSLLFQMMESNMNKWYWKFHNDTVNSFGIMGKEMPYYSHSFMFRCLISNFICFIYTVIPSK